MRINSLNCVFLNSVWTATGNKTFSYPYRTLLSGPMSGIINDTRDVITQTGSNMLKELRDFIFSDNAKKAGVLERFPTIERFEREVLRIMKFRHDDGQLNLWYFALLHSFERT